MVVLALMGMLLAELGSCRGGGRSMVFEGRTGWEACLCWVRLGADVQEAVW